MAANQFQSVLRPRSLASRVAPRPPYDPAGLTPALALLGAAVCAAAVTISASGAQSDAAFGRGLVELLIVATPIAAGLYALRAPVSAGFGAALLAIGFLWSLTALSETSLSVPYTIGRIVTWFVFPSVVYLLLAFPDGRIASGLDRFLFAGILALLVLLHVGTVPLIEAFPSKTLWATCAEDCPPNALFVLDRQPAFLDELILVREWLVELFWLGLFVSMSRRWRAASPLRRRALGPVFVAGALLGVAHIGFLTYRQLGGPADTVIALSSAWTLCIVAVCGTFVLGLVRRRTLLAGALARLGPALRAGTSPAHARDALATALGDSTIDLLIRDPASGTWRDASGRRVERPPSGDARRAVTTLGAVDGSPEVVLVHDVALCDDPELLDGVSAMVVAVWRHERTMYELARAMRELEASRRRVAEAATLERARIERDLHDGAQQRLVALRIRLGLAEDQLRSDPAAGIAAVHELGFEAERALEELRSLAHGVYPPLLADRGLPEALRSLAVDAPLPIQVSADGVGRYPIEIESAVYFSCAEAVQNAMKHAQSATGLSIEVEQTDGVLGFEVRDGGRGFAPRDQSGRGVRNMRDRLEAVGGRLTIDSEPGRGTRVVGSVGVA